MKTQQALIDRIKSRSAELRKEAAEAKEAGATKIPEQDPRDKGDTAIPKDPEASEDKQNLPPRQDNMRSNEDQKLEDGDTHPVSTGKNVPSTESGKAKDDAYTAPNTPISKISSLEDRIKAARERIDALKNQNAKEAGDQNQAGGTGTQAEPKKAADAKDAGAEDKPKEDCSKKADDKQAAEDIATQIARDLEGEDLLKLARLLVTTEGGLQAVEPVLVKAAGQREVADMLRAAAEQHDRISAIEKAAYDEQMAQAAYEQEVLKAASETLAAMPAEEREKLAAAVEDHQNRCDALEGDRIKIAYMGGVQDAAAMMDAGGEMPPEEAVPEGEPSPEEIADIIDQLVQSGELDEETGAALLAEVMGGAEGGEVEGEEMEAPQLGGMVAEASNQSEPTADELVAKLS